MNKNESNEPVTLSEATPSLRPGDATELSRILRKASTEQTKILTGGAFLSEVSEHKGSIVIDLSALDSVVEHVQEDMVITVETGIKIAELNRYLARSGQWLPVNGSSPNSSVNELIETGNGGPLDTGFGGPRNLVLGLDSILADGSAFKSGGKIVKNVTGYDLTKLLVGSRSWLGISHRAHLRLFALPQFRQALLMPLESPDIIPGFCKSLIASGIAIKVLEIASADFLPERFERFALVADFGHRKEVEESMDHLEELVSNMSGVGKIHRLEKDALDGLLDKLAGFSLSDNAVCDLVELAAPLKLIPEILNEVEGCTFSLRPLQGKLTLKLKKDHLDSLERKLAFPAMQCSLAGAITLAHRSDDGLYKVKTINQVNHAIKDNATRLSNLKESIKKRFDPEFILNPGIRF
ncbi:FAD-binding protein [bacterium]|nr:FAD-binding protein [bacterium]